MAATEGYSARGLGRALPRQLVCPFPGRSPSARVINPRRRASTSRALPGPSAAAGGGPGSPGFRFPTWPTSAGACTRPTETRRRYPPPRTWSVSPAGAGRRCTCRLPRSSLCLPASVPRRSPARPYLSSWRNSIPRSSSSAPASAACTRRARSTRPPVRDHRGRSPQPPPVPADALPGGGRRPQPVRHRHTDPPHPPAARPTPRSILADVARDRHRRQGHSDG